MNTHNIFFYGEIWKIIRHQIPTLSVSVYVCACKLDTRLLICHFSIFSTNQMNVNLRLGWGYGLEVSIRP